MIMSAHLLHLGCIYIRMRKKQMQSVKKLETDQVAAVVPNSQQINVDVLITRF